MLTNFTRVARSLKVTKRPNLTISSLKMQIFKENLSHVAGKFWGLLGKKILSVNSCLSLFFDFGQKAASI
jgi:hypothetical protein